MLIVLFSFFRSSLHKLSKASSTTPMNCPVCARSLAPTLSICPSCGAMRNDTVREELETKIVQGPPPKLEAKPIDAIPERRALVTKPPVPAPVRRVTSDLVAPPTSPTLVGFQNKNTSVPECPLQMQNAVLQRKTGHRIGDETGMHFPTNGGAALKAEPA